MEILSYLDQRTIPSSRKSCDDELQQLQLLINGYDSKIMKSRRQKEQERINNNGNRYSHHHHHTSSATIAVVNDNGFDSTTTTTTHRNVISTTLKTNTSISSTATSRRTTQDSPPRALLVSSTLLPAIDVFPIEVIRILISSGFLSPQQVGKFVLFTSKSLLPSVGSSYVWKSICCQYWPISIIDVDGNNNDVDLHYLQTEQREDDTTYQKLFHQLLRPAKLVVRRRSYNYNYHQHNNNNNNNIGRLHSYYLKNKEGNLRLHDHCEQQKLRSIHSHYRRRHAKKLLHSFDLFSFTIMIRFDDDDMCVESYRLDCNQMKQLVDTGTVCLNRKYNNNNNHNNSRSSSNSCCCSKNDHHHPMPSSSVVVPRSAYWHVWKTKNKQDDNDDDERIVTCLNESHKPVWNIEKNGYQFLTDYIDLTERGRCLLKRKQQLDDHNDDDGNGVFGGLKFQIIASTSNIQLEIRKRHGCHPTGLFRSSISSRCYDSISSRQPQQQQQKSNNSGHQYHDSDNEIGLFDFLQELAGWES